MFCNGGSHAEGDTQQAAPARATATTCDVRQENPTTDEMTASTAAGELTDADIAKIVAPNRLYFQPYEIVRHGYVVSGVPRTPAASRRSSSWCAASRRGT